MLTLTVFGNSDTSNGRELVHLRLPDLLYLVTGKKRLKAISDRAGLPLSFVQSARPSCAPRAKGPEPALFSHGRGNCKVPISPQNPPHRDAFLGPVGAEHEAYNWVAALPGRVSNQFARLWRLGSNSRFLVLPRSARMRLCVREFARASHRKRLNLVAVDARTGWPASRVRKIRLPRNFADWRSQQANPTLLAVHRSDRC